MAYRRQLFASIAAFITLAALPQVAPQSAAGDSCTEEDYAIYASALNNLFSAKNPPKLVLINQTSTGVPPGMAAMTQFVGKAQELLKKFSANGLATFESRNKSHVTIEVERVRTTFPIALLTWKDANKSVAGAWEDFHNKYPHSGINLVSLPAFNGGPLCMVSTCTTHPA